MTQLWKQHLAKSNPKAADLIADPAQYPNLFPSLSESLIAEQFVADTVKPRPASELSFLSLFSLISLFFLLTFVSFVSVFRYAAMRHENARDYLEEAKHWNKSDAPLIDLSNSPKKDPIPVAKKQEEEVPAKVEALIDLSVSPKKEDVLVPDEEFPDLELALNTPSKKNE